MLRLIGVIRLILFYNQRFGSDGVTLARFKWNKLWTTKLNRPLPFPLPSSHFPYLLPDRKTGLKTFFTNRELDKLPATTSPNGRAYLPLVMRRDFSSCDLVCRVEGGKEGVLPLTKVQGERWSSKGVGEIFLTEESLVIVFRLITSVPHPSNAMRYLLEGGV